MIHEKLSIKAYHEHEALGSTDLKRALRSVLHMKAGRENDKPDSRALRIGQAVHTFILEPELFEQQFYELPEFKGVGSRLRREQFVNERSALTCLSKDEFEVVARVGQAVRNHPLARRLLHSGLAERSHFWLDEDYGLMLKCRPDFYSDDGYIVDLKTTQDASPDAFRKTVANYQYHLQAALYLDGLSAQGLPPNDIGFIFVAVESDKPHAVGVYILDELAIKEGRRLYKAALKRITDAAKSVATVGYSDKLVQLSLPAWGYKSEEWL